MGVTDTDRLFYTIAIDRITQQFEISREFVRYNGLPSIPIEQLQDMMIKGIKEWVVGEDGQEWMATLGYNYHAGAVVSGVVFLGDSMCPSCSGSFLKSYGSYCESCGSYVCPTCNSIVDPIYHISWCERCLRRYPSITSLLSINE